MTEAGSVAVRPTARDDCRHLPAIEQSAAQAFRGDPALAWLADEAPISGEHHAELLDRGIGLVAVDGSGRLCGFVASERHGADLHVVELSVHADWQRRGIGRMLLSALAEEARGEGIAQLTLTTFRDLAWNGPFYRSSGFNELAEGAHCARLASLLAAEAEHGLPRGRRCAMVRPL